MTSRRRSLSRTPSSFPLCPPGATITTLDNGLTLIVAENRSAPVVSAQAWCRTGSIHEGRWLGAGLSHVLEHMLFKGTARRTGAQIDHEIQDAGGYLNAYTSFDRTVYWINVPNTGARVALDILCDIMQHASLPPEELARELDVIRREMDMNQDDPGRRSSRRLFETAYTQSPYRLTVIGYPDIFDRLTMEDIQAYYRERYVPNNIFLVVTGDIRPAQVVEQVKQAWAGSRARPLPPMVLPLEPAQTAPRETIEEAPIELAHVHLSWHIPDLRHPDLPALDALAVLLGGGRSSRLYQQVREKLGLVHSVEAWTYSPGQPGLLGLSAVMEAQQFPGARDALLVEVEKLKTERVAAGELRKAVKQFLSGTLASRKTMQGQAQDLGGSWLAAHDLHFSERYLGAIQRVTPADLRRVARQYLTAENRTLYALLPAGTAPKTISSVAVTTDHPITKHDLPGGLRLLVKEDPRLPFVEFRTVFQGGVLAETATNNGISQLLARMLLKGTRRRSARRIVTEIESIGGHLDSYGGHNSLGVNAEVLSADFAAGLRLVADVLRNPTFPAAEVAREREVQMAGIRSQRDNLLKSAGLAMRRRMFGTHGYGLDTLGSEASVARLERTELQRLHRRLFTPDNCVLAIYGDVKTAAVRTAVTKAFQGWEPGKGAPLPGVVARRPPAGARHSGRVEELRDKKQAVVVIGFPGVTLHSPDRFALELLQEACCDLGSRLFLRVREKLGLAYYVGAQNFLGLAPGYFAFYAGTEPAKAAQVERELLEEARLLADEGLTAAELQRAKTKLIGQKKIARQDLGSLAATTSLDELYGLGYGNIDTEDACYEAVDRDTIRTVAKRCLSADDAVVSVLNPGADAAGVGGT
jgi:zinc protease